MTSAAIPGRAIVFCRPKLLLRAMSELVALQPGSESMSVAPIATKDHVVFPEYDQPTETILMPRCHAVSRAI